MRTWLIAIAVLGAGALGTGCGGDSHSTDGGTDAGGGGDTGTMDEDAFVPPGEDGGDPEEDAGEPDTGTDAGTPEMCDEPGTLEVVDCGRCGSQERFCNASGVWEYTECIDGPGAVCDPGTTMMAPCGMCGTQRVRCDTSCRYIASGACEGESGECMPGEAEIDRAGCGATELRRRTCADDCDWGPYGMCEAIPDDFDGDGVPYDMDCDDTNASVVIGSTRGCGVYYCTGMMGARFNIGTQTCMGPGWSACSRPATCTATATCAMGTSEQEECASECVPGYQRSRTCVMGMWGPWSACGGGMSTRPASCDPDATTCGMCDEGLAYTICGPRCTPVTVGCMGTGCTPGAITRTTMGCAAGEYRESVCSDSCMPGLPGDCRPYPPDVDVIIAVDVTGSHTALVMRNAATLANDLAAELLMDADVRVGVALFADFDTGPYGSPGDVPFRGVLAPTDDLDMVEAALRGLPGMSGGDGPESGVEALWTLAGGMAHPESEGFACPAGSDGGGCWRRGSQRIVVVVTDITQHNGPEIDGSGDIHDPYMGIDPAPATWASTIAQMRTSGVALFGLAPEGGWSPEFDGDNQLMLMAEDLGQDPAISVVSYPTGAMDWSTEVRELAGHIATYVGL